MSDMDDQRRIFISLMAAMANRVLLIDLTLFHASFDAARSAEIIAASRQQAQEVVDLAKSIVAELSSIADSEPPMGEQNNAAEALEGPENGTKKRVH